MRWALMSAIMLLLPTWNAGAQVSSYGFTQSNGAYTALAAPTVLATATANTTAGSLDNAVYNITLPFAFTFNGASFTSLNVSTNGFVTFGATAPSTAEYTPISSSTTYSGAISAFAGDLNSTFALGTPPRTGEISWAVIGTSPNQEIVIQWKNWRPAYTVSTTSAYTFNFQIHLFQTSNNISIVYDAGSFAVGSTSVSGTRQVGLRGATNTDYNNRTNSTSVLYTASSAGTSNSASQAFNTSTTPPGMPAAGLTYTYTPPPPCNSTVAAGSISPLTQYICAGATPATLTATGYTTGATNLVYQWEESNDDGVTDPWSNAVGGTGANTAVYTPPAFAGTIYYRFRITCGTNSNTAVSASAVVNPPANPSTPATAITFSNVNSTSMTIGWTAGNGGRRYVVISPVNSFTNPVNGQNGPATPNTAYAGAGQQVVYDGTGTSVTITGLACNTTYYVRVYEYQRCGSAAPYDYYFTTATTATNPASQQTASITTTTMPVSNDFTGFTGSNLSTVFPGWYEAAIVTPSTTLPGQTDPAGSTSTWRNTSAFTGVTTAAVNLYTTTRNEWIISPKINLTGSVAPQLKFKAAITDYAASTTDVGMQGTDDKVYVLVSTDGCGKIWTPIYTFQASNTTNLTNVLTDYTLSLSAYTGQTIQIAFQGTDGPVDDAPDYDFHIGNVVVQETPSCPVPTLLTATAVTSTGATLGWTSTGTQFQVEYGTGAFGTGTRVITSSNPYTVSGLTANSAYNFYVRRICGAGDTSVWSGALPFATPCAPQAIPYTQGFDVAGLPSCWTRSIVSGTTDWAAVVGGSGDIAAPYAGAGFMEKNYSTSESILYSPGFNLSTLTPGQQARTTMFLHRHASANVNDRYQIYVNTSPSLTGATLLLDMYSLTTSAPAVPATGWYPYALNIPTSFNSSSSVYIIYRGTTTAGFSSYDLGLDNFVVELVPSCLEPGTPVVSNIGVNGATISWTASTSNPGNGYRYEVRTSGAAGSGPTGLTLTGTTAAGITTANVAGLSSNTTYTVYVRSLCSASDSSAYSAGASFLTNCQNYTLPYTENFSPFPTTCWSEARGVLAPGANVLTAGNYTWTEDGYLNSGTTGAAKINLYSTVRKDWLISPTIDLGNGGYKVLEFNLGIVSFGGTTATTLGSDDTVAVVISTDNGSTWNTANVLRTWTAANTPITGGGQRYYLPLQNYSGLVKIGFYGSEGVVDDANDNDVFVDSFRISTCTPPVVNLGNDTTLCSGNQLTLNAGAATSYEWSTNAATQTITVSGAGTYSVTAYNGNPGCFARDTIVVSTGTAPVVSLGNDTAICAGTALTLNAGNSGSTYLWNPGATTAQTRTVTTAGAYSVAVTNASGCTGRDTINVTVNALPIVNLGNDTAFCAGNSLVLNAGNPGATYLWTPGNTTAQTRTVSTSGTYNVAVTNANGCTASDAVTITVNTAPVVNLGNDMTVCGNATNLVLDAGNPGSTYTWGPVTNTTQTLDITAAVNAANANASAPNGLLYWATVTNANGCTGRDSILVNINYTPRVSGITVSGSAPSFSFVPLGDSFATDYTWDFGDGSGPANGQSTSHTYAANGTYNVQLVVSNSCGSDTVSAQVTVSGLGVTSVLADQEVSVFPNPASAAATIELRNSAARLQSVQLISPMGAVVKDIALSDKRGTIQLDGLASGIYTLRIRTDKGLVVRRLEVIR